MLLQILPILQHALSIRITGSYRQRNVSYLCLGINASLKHTKVVQESNELIRIGMRSKKRFVNRRSFVKSLAHVIHTLSYYTRVLVSKPVFQIMVYAIIG